MNNYEWISKNCTQEEVSRVVKSFVYLHDHGEWPNGSKHAALDKYVQHLNSLGASLNGTEAVVEVAFLRAALVTSDQYPLNWEPLP